MRALVQRVRRASVTIDGELSASIGPGMLVLLGVHEDDSDDQLKWLVRKCAALRIFADEDGRMNRSILQSGGDILVVSQFTLYGSVERGNRPSFEKSAGPEHAEPLYERFVEALAEHTGKTIATGVFGAMMDVELVNDGPVTLMLEK